MQELNDMQLLRAYDRDGSEEAFAEVVRRQVNLVYSAALRHSNIPAHAEEITQAVFIILAKKAGSLHPDTVLEGWLQITTRLTASSFIRGERRRQFREQEAYMQSTLPQSAQTDVWEQMAPLLDEAVAGLGTNERDAVMLRFFKEKSHREVAAALKVSENTAQQRVSRAVEKLRKFFLKRGVALSAAAMTGAISTHSIKAAPVALAKSITPVAVAKGAVASSSILTLVKATLITMKTKTILASSAIALAIILGAGTCLIYKNGKGHVLAPTTGEVLPIKFINWSGPPDTSMNGKFLKDSDEANRRTPDSKPPGHMKCLVPPTKIGSADYLQSVGTNGGGAYSGELAAVKQFRYDITKKSAFYGKRVRITGWMKVQDVRNWAGVTMLLTDTNGSTFHDDNMADRPLHGTTDWQQIEIVTDIPEEPCILLLRPTIYSTGEMWYDDFQIDLAPPNLPFTDDRKWHTSSPNAAEYTAAPDNTTMHDGHPAVCLAYTGEEPAPKGSWMWWGYDIHYPEKYYGHTVQVSVWTKSENVSETAGPNLRPTGANYKSLASDGQPGHHPIHGTTDWTLRKIHCVIPKTTQIMAIGMYFGGGGKVWYDQDAIKIEIIK